MELKRRQIERLEPVIVRGELIEAQSEAIIPDSCSDVMRIAASYANIKLNDKNVSTDRITFNGSCDINIICATETNPSGEIIKTAVSFSHVVSSAGISVDDTIISNASVVECITSIINSRKISIKVKMLLKVKVYENRNLWITTDIPEKENMYCLCKEYCDEYVSFVAEKQLRIIENISLESEEIKPFRWSADFITEDVKLIKNKVMIRGTCQLRVLFLNAATGELLREKYHLPFSTVIESNGFTNAETIEAEYKCVVADVIVNSTGSGFNLNCDVAANIIVTAKNQIFEKIIGDVFNSKYELDTKWEKLNGIVKINTENVNKDFSAVFENIDNAVDVNDFTYAVTKQISGKKVYISINFNIVYKDSMGDIYGAVCKHDLEYELSNTFYDLKVHLNNVSMQCGENGSLKADGQIVLEVSYGSNIETQQLVSCEILKDSFKTKTRNASLVLRKVDKGETLWDIAKRYNTSPEAVSLVNNIEDSTDIGGRLIMIPIVK
ncbi:MAG: DUF3794 domain-containing protein [Clostridia bacterium]|nr:DUF3794 domain-containing protein [Clostridia bacterium]